MKNIDDPTVHCLMPGIPRVVGMPFPLEIIQTPNKIVILYEAFRTFRVIPTDGKQVGGESRAFIQRRFCRALGRRHAGCRCDEFQRQDLGAGKHEGHQP